MRLRCDSQHAGHTCSLFLDWLGHHPGDHVSHHRHDPSLPVRATWPNDGLASMGVPVHGAPAAVPATPPPTPAPTPAPTAPARTAPANVRAIRPRVDPYAEEITEWDLLPDA